MAESSRLEELRRRVQKDPASLAFAQLAEELRRAGSHQEAARVCRAGLRLHPEYHSARVTLGLALAALDQLDAAAHELEAVIRAAPQNLAACRGLAEVCLRQGRPGPALAHLRTASALAPGDAELAEQIGELQRLSPPPAQALPDRPGAAAKPTAAAEPDPADCGEPAGRRLLSHLEGWLERLEAGRGR